MKEKTPHKIGFPRLDRLAHWPFKKRRWVGVFFMREWLSGVGSARWDAYEKQQYGELEKKRGDAYEMHMSRLRDAYETSSYLRLFHVRSYRCKRQSQCHVNVNVNLNVKRPIPRDVMSISGKEFLSLGVNPLSHAAWKLFPLKRSSI